MNELEQLLSMLGAATFAEAAATITNLNAAIDGVKSATGKGTAQEALAEQAMQAKRSPFALAVEKATGKTGDEAIGLIHAALASHAELPKAQTKVAELEQATQAHALDALLALAKDAKKLTPAIEKNVRDALSAGDITLKGAESWLANLTPIAALQSAEPPAPPSTTPNHSAIMHEGKTYAQLSNNERAALAKNQPELFEQMRAAFKPGAR